MASFDFNKRIGNTFIGFLTEGFYTKLNDAFVNEFGVPDDNNVVIYTRTNAKDGARVYGVNTELNVVPSGNFSLTAGFTIQASEYENEQEFNEKSFLRTPNKYGFVTIDWDFAEKWCFSSSGNYTGRMLLPYYGHSLPDPDAGVLLESDSFFDFGAKLEYNTKLNSAGVQIFAGMKNIFNSYQNDFDRGVNRDPGYVYGPGSPRAIYFGVKIGNLL